MKLFEDISLSSLQTDDAADIYGAIDAQREYLGRWLPFVAYTDSVAFTQAFVDASVAADDRTYTIRKGDTFIGLIGFKATDKGNRKTEIGYWLSAEHQGYGIITRAVDFLCQHAFEELGMNRIQIKCAVGNHRSSNVPKRLGFHYEGVERAGELFPDGSFADIEVYSLLREDHATHPFSIRQATLDDIVEIIALYQDTVQTINKRDYSEAEVEDWASCGTDSNCKMMIETHYFIVAVTPLAQIVGFSSITAKGYLHSMFVHKDFQRQGVAILLLHEIERHARKNSIPIITSEVSLTARPFFERQGYVVVKEHKRQANRLYLTNFEMEKTLHG